MQVHPHKAKTQEKRRTQYKKQGRKCHEMCKHLYVCLVWGKIKANKQNICKETFQDIVFFQKQHDWQTVTCSDYGFA